MYTITIEHVAEQVARAKTALAQAGLTAVAGGIEADRYAMQWQTAAVQMAIAGVAASDLRNLCAEQYHDDDRADLAEEAAEACQTAKAALFQLMQEREADVRKGLAQRSRVDYE